MDSEIYDGVRIDGQRNLCTAEFMGCEIDGGVLPFGLLLGFGEKQTQNFLPLHFLTGGYGEKNQSVSPKCSCEIAVGE